jgi:hypothetical protein
MNQLSQRFGALLFLLVGGGLLLLGLLALNHLANNFWPFDTLRLDLVRSVALGQAEATVLLRASNREIIFAFLAGVMVAVTGLALPLAYYLNRRFGNAPDHHFLVVLRQGMWVGIWAAFIVWLQMNRAFNWGVVLLVAVVFALFEILLQVRTRAADVSAA